VKQYLSGRIVVISPHLDDAALSVGATIAHASRVGADVTVVTIFAGDPFSTTPAGLWDRGCGFRSAGEATRTLRKEDSVACHILGAKSVWLPFRGIQYDRERDSRRILAALEPHVNGVDLLLLPGYPLAHPDHAWVTEALFSKASEGLHVGFYVEQPYARQNSGGPTSDGRRSSVRWDNFSASIADRLTKGRACRAYRSQFRGFRCHLSRKLLLPELFWADELLGLP
jgi:LmbE family N-acetylglucosaminyl deacetylase